MSRSSLKKLLITLYGNHCYECGSQFEEIDHYFKPYCLGGSSSADNLRPLCRKCNRQKSNKTLIEFKLMKGKNTMNSIITIQILQAKAAMDRIINQFVDLGTESLKSIFEDSLNVLPTELVTSKPTKPTNDPDILRLKSITEFAIVQQNGQPKLECRFPKHPALKPLHSQITGRMRIQTSSNKYKIVNNGQNLPKKTLLKLLEPTIAFQVQRILEAS